MVSLFGTEKECGKICRDASNLIKFTKFRKKIYSICKKTV